MLEVTTYNRLMLLQMNLRSKILLKMLSISRKRVVNVVVCSKSSRLRDQIGLPMDKDFANDQVADKNEPCATSVKAAPAAN